MKKKSYADMDPLEEIRAIKEEISREFKTVAAYSEYLRKKYPSASGPVPEFPAPKVKRKGSGQRKASKRLTPA